MTEFHCGNCLQMVMGICEPKRPYKLCDGFDMGDLECPHHGPQFAVAFGISSFICEECYTQMKFHGLPATRAHILTMEVSE